MIEAYRVSLSHLVESCAPKTAAHLEWILADAARAGLACSTNNSTSAAVQCVKGNVGANAKTKRTSPWADDISASPLVAGRRRNGADISARAAVGTVKPHVNTHAAAICEARGAGTAFPPVAVRGRCGADVPAGAAVGRIGTQKRAGPVAVDSARDAAVNAKSANARDNLIGRRRGTLPAAASAVVDVVVESGAMTAATRLARGAANVAPAGSADAVGVAVAPLTGLETLRLLRLIAAFAEGFAGVGASAAQLRARPGGLQSQRGEHRGREHGSQPPQRFAARHRLGQ